jgi:hypothetical protein
MLMSCVASTAAAALGVRALSSDPATAPSRQARPQASAARQCLHGADAKPEDQARRRAAVGMARAINTEESRAFSRLKQYVVIDGLQNIPATPAGFKVNVSADPLSYTFSLKDTLDPCGFALFSDQNGLIYRAEPMQ